ncbi:hypothetical protein TSAR_011650 [Trichomalopsis sarcophagae]|uniref:Uncharacterized protein n=1 Tax=Trichomalopsis sarcophagae TaxID=543379 RepID=A0A232EZG0_9HYME|nr:hypothetical protein TSAR_011650 [Trichomalopsis sarcophagae]
MFKFVILLCACIATANAGYLGAAPIAYSAPVAIAAPAPIIRAAPLAIAAPLPVLRAAPVAYGTSSIVKSAPIAAW